MKGSLIIVALVFSEARFIAATFCREWADRKRNERMAWFWTAVVFGYIAITLWEGGGL